MDMDKTGSPQKIYLPYENYKIKDNKKWTVNLRCRGGGWGVNANGYIF